MPMVQIMSMYLRAAERLLYISMKKSQEIIKKVNKNSLFISKNKRMGYIVMAILSVLIVISAISIINSTNLNTPLDKNAVIKSEADKLKSLALQQIHIKPESAQTMLIEARQKYQQINDKNNMIDVDAQLYLISHSKVKK